VHGTLQSFRGARWTIEEPAQSTIQRNVFRFQLLFLGPVGCASRGSIVITRVVKRIRIIIDRGRLGVKPSDLVCLAPLFLNSARLANSTELKVHTLTVAPGLPAATVEVRYLLLSVRSTTS